MRTPSATKPIRATKPKKRKSRLTKPPVKQEVLHTPDVPMGARVRPLETHRVTPDAFAFIVTYILAGYSNSEISQMLREYGFVLEGEPDLSYRTFQRIRASQDCQMSVEMLTMEARQVGHNILSEFTLSWARLGKAAFGRMLDGVDYGYSYPRVSLHEDVVAAAKATDFLFSTFADGLPARLRRELEGEAEEPEQDVTTMNADQLAQYLEGVMAATYTRAVKMIEQKRQEANARPTLPEVKEVVILEKEIGENNAD